MRALVFDEFGGPEVLTVQERPAPRPGPGEVLVRVTAAGVNAFDTQIRQDMAGFPIPLPFVGGLEAVGVVEEVGAEVEDWAPGDRVLRDMLDSCGRCGRCRSGQEWRCAKGDLTLNSISGGFAELLVCAARRLVAIPPGVDDVTAAAVQLSYGTAWHMLHAQAGVQSGDTVLVSSIGSGLGWAAADIARAASATVIGTASTDEKLAKAKARGFDDVINYTTTDLREEIGRLTAGGGVDIAIEHTGGDAFSTALESLAIDGRLVTCGWSAGSEASIDLMNLVRGRKQIIGSAGRTADELRRALVLVEQGTLAPAIDSTFDLADAPAAFELQASRQAFGKIVLNL